MNRHQTATLRNHALHYKHLTVGDVRPDATMRLYRRMFDHVRRKYIPVKSITEDDAGRELNAYLINPEYIEKSIQTKGMPAYTSAAQVMPAVVQYSKLSDVRPARHKDFTVPRYTTKPNTTILKSFRNIIAKANSIAQGIFTKPIHLPIGKTYSLTKGTSFKRRKKILAQFGVVSLILAGGVLGLASILDQSPGIQQPEIAASNPKQTNPASDSTDNQPVDQSPTTDQTTPVSRPGLAYGNPIANTAMPITEFIPQSTPTNSKTTASMPLATETPTPQVHQQGTNPSLSEILTDTLGGTTQLLGDVTTLVTNDILQ